MAFACLCGSSKKKNKNREGGAAQHTSGIQNTNPDRDERSNSPQDNTSNHAASSSGMNDPDTRDRLHDTNSNERKARHIKYQDLVIATENFRPDRLLGEGGFGKVYKGQLPLTDEVVAIKKLDREGSQGNHEFVIEVITLSNADHPNLVKLVGFCAEAGQKLLVYEYMPLGSLERHIHDLSPEKKGLDWNTRMRIAFGAARGLEYLHDIMNPPLIYRDLKCSNILLGEGYHPKLSDFGFVKVGPSGDRTHVSTRVMGTSGYCAPDYLMTGQLTYKSDIYSFGVVLLELITGRKAIDPTKPSREQNLVAWARPYFRDRRKFLAMADPLLEGQFPFKGLYQALAIAAMCVQEQPSARPLVADLVTAFDYLCTQTLDPNPCIPSTSRQHEIGNDDDPRADEEGTSKSDDNDEQIR